MSPQYLFFFFFFFFFNDTATTEIYTLSLHDALPIYSRDDLLDDRVLHFDGHRRACQKRAQLRGFRVHCAKSAELFGGRLRGALFERNVGQSVRVLKARRSQFCLPSRLCTRLLMSDSCAFGVSSWTRSDCAPSTASCAARALSSSRPARSAASISAFAAAAIFSASVCVAARMRATSAADSRAATARSSAISFWMLASLFSASRSCASAAALALPALVIAELIASARRRKNPGAFFQHNQRSTLATMAKLIQLKISLAVCAVALPPCSAARAVATAKKDTKRMLERAKTPRFRLIEPLWRERPGPDGAGLAGLEECGARFRRKAAPPSLPPRGEQPQVPRQYALSRH